MSVQLPPRPVHQAPPPAGRRSVWALTGIAVGVVLALVLATLALTRSDTGTTPSPSTTPGTTVATSAAPTPSAAASTAVTPTPSAATSQAVAPSTFRFLALWPFTSVADAARWQADSANGQQAWRLDPGQTALTFATTYLGYTGMDRVVSLKTSGDEAWVGIGFTAQEGTGSAAAVLHLARIGTGTLAFRPWEVVGSQDNLLTLTTPAYGSTVKGALLTVGGRITGVDESLVVTVLDSTGARLATRGGLPAGGTSTPWKATLVVAPTAMRLVTVAVSTGGHVAAVERFAITGVWLRPDAAAKTFATPEAALASTVATGTSIGACPTGAATPTAVHPVCSVALSADRSRALYRVGTWQTDSGYYVLLVRDANDRWLVAISNLAGADVPADLGGPLG